MDEAERSLHDALCVIRCIVKKRYMLIGGGAPETEIYTEFMKWSKTLQGAESYIVYSSFRMLMVRLVRMLRPWRSFLTLSLRMPV